MPPTPSDQSADHGCTFPSCRCEWSKRTQHCPRYGGTTKGYQAVSVPPWSDDDPYTIDAKLCDDDGIVRRGAMHHGTDYPCTGHAHFAGEHIRCISQAHPSGLPTEFLEALRAAPPEAIRKHLPDVPLDALVGDDADRRRWWIAHIEGRPLA